MQPNFFFLTGVLIGTAIGLVVDYRQWRKPGEALDWGYVGASFKYAFLGMVAGELAYRLDPTSDLSGLSVATAGILAGAVAHWRASSDERKQRILEGK